MDELKVIPGDKCYVIDYELLKIRNLKVSRVEIVNEGKENQVYVSFDSMQKPYKSNLVYLTEIEALRQLKNYKDGLKLGNERY